MPGGNSFNIVMATGTAEKLVMLGVLTQTSANLGMPVRIFVTGTALKSFRKNGFKEKPVMPAGFEDYMKGLVLTLHFFAVTLIVTSYSPLFS